MSWYKKLSQKRDASPSKGSEMFKWIKRSKDVQDDESPLKKEIDVVPRTEITSSRQTLENINTALHVGESSAGESSEKKLERLNESFDYGNKHYGDENTDPCVIDSGGHDSAKNCKSSKVNLTDTLRSADINAHAPQGSLLDETLGRPSPVIRNVKNAEYIIHFDPYVDYGRLECPDLIYPDLDDHPSATYGRYVELKGKKDRHTSEAFDLFTKSDRIKTKFDKTTINYELLSNVEKNLDQSKYNLFKCRAYNKEYREINQSIGSNCVGDYTLEDFNDDNESTRMSIDTKTIKEFYRLNIDSNVLIHFQDISVHVGQAEPPATKKFLNFCLRLVLKGNEITEQHKITRSWIKEVLKFLKRKHPRNKTDKVDPGDGVEAYTLALAQDESSVFAKNIYNFIACTRESREKIPHKVMRNIRQFMNGMKNYLVKHGEKDFGCEVDKARAALKPDEFLNLDQILEGVMHQLVILPLKDYLYELFVDFYGSRGDIELIISNMKFGENKDPIAFGVKKGLKTPSPQALNRISMLFAKLQEAELPFEKLDFLLTAMTTILDNTIDPESESNDVRHFGCDDFLPLLAYVLCKCGFHFAEIEAEYIWGLMMPTVMNGQAGYYTTSLCSAALSLKEFKQQYENPEGILVPNNSLECSVLRIIIPNEYNGSIQTKTIPVRPHTTTKDVIRIIAHKSQITNAMDYGLFKLTEGEETLLMDNDCPQDIRLASAGKHCTLVFRRFDSKIAWPKQ